MSVALKRNAGLPYEGSLTCRAGVIGRKGALQAPDQRDAAFILPGSLEVSVRGFRDPREIAVVLEIREFDSPADWIGSRAAYERLVVLGWATGNGVDGFHDGLRVAVLAQPLERPARAVLDHIVEDSGDSLVERAETQHDSEGMEDVGIACLVDDACASFAASAMACSRVLMINFSFVHTKV